MADNHIRIRVNRSCGELEVEGPSTAVAEWWDKLWPMVNTGSTQSKYHDGASVIVVPDGDSTPEAFGEFASSFRTDMSAVDQMLVAGAYIQDRDPDRVFTTKAANQLLQDQNIKLANASNSVRRLMGSKRVFAVSKGRFRVSASGLEYLDELRTPN